MWGRHGLPNLVEGRGELFLIDVQTLPPRNFAIVPLTGVPEMDERMPTASKKTTAFTPARVWGGSDMRQIPSSERPG